MTDASGIASLEIKLRAAKLARLLLVGAIVQVRSGLLLLFNFLSTLCQRRLLFSLTALALLGAFGLNTLDSFVLERTLAVDAVGLWGILLRERQS